MLNKFFIAAFSAASLLLGSSDAVQASYLASILIDGPNSLEDQNRDAFVDIDGNGFDVGDVLIGFVRMDNKDPAVGGVGDLENRVYSVFSQQIAEFNPLGPGIFQVIFEETTAAGYTLTDLTGVATPGGVSAIYSSATAITDLILGPPAGALDMFDYIAEITSNMELTLVAGFGTGGTTGDDYFEALAFGLTPAFLADPTLIPSQFAAFHAGLSILYNVDANVIYNESVVSTNLGTHQLVIANGAVRGGTGASGEGIWGSVDDGSTSVGFVTDADFFVNVSVVPEPSSMALFGLGIGALGFVRRRKAAAAAKV